MDKPEYQRQTKPEFLDILKLNSKDLQFLLTQIPPTTLALVTKESPHGSKLTKRIFSHLKRAQYILTISEFHKVWPKENERISAENEVTAIISKLKSSGDISYHFEDPTLDAEDEVAELVRVFASVINELPNEISNLIKSKLSKTHPLTVERLDKYKIQFHELYDLKDEDFKKLLGLVANDKVLLALKGSDDRMLEKFCKNLSPRGAKLLRDDLADLKGFHYPPSVCKSAQRAIAIQASQLFNKGKIDFQKPS